MVKKSMTKVKRSLAIIPSEQKLRETWEFQIRRPGLQGENRRNLHECLFLLCWKAGLRISEAISFDLAFAHPEKEGLFSLRGKGAKDR